MAWNDETILQESPVLLAELEQLELNNLEGFDFTDPPAGPEVPGGMDEGAIGGTPAEQILAVLPDPITAQLLAQVGQDVAPGLSALMVTSVPSSDFPCEDGGELIPYETPEGAGAGQTEQPVTQFGVLVSDVVDDLAGAMQGVLSPGLDQAGVNCYPWICWEVLNFELHTYSDWSCGSATPNGSGSCDLGTCTRTEFVTPYQRIPFDCTILIGTPFVRNNVPRKGPTLTVPVIGPGLCPTPPITVVSNPRTGGN